VEERELRRALTYAVQVGFESPNEMDQNGETANVVDGLFAIARALDNVARSIREAR
jgi:hypothetical protein